MNPGSASKHHRLTSQGTSTRHDSTHLGPTSRLQRYMDILSSAQGLSLKHVGRSLVNKNSDIIRHLYGGFLSHRGTPSHHPFLDGIFPYKPTSYWGTPMTMEIPIPPIPIYISHHIVYKWIIIPFTSSIYHQQKPHLVVSLSLSYPTKHTRIYPAIHLGQPDVPDGG